MSARAVVPAATAAARIALLERRLGRRVAPAPDPERLEPAPSLLEGDAGRRARLRRALGEEPLLGPDARLRYAFGGGLGEALRRRAPGQDPVPDAVVLPRDEAAVLRLLAEAAALDLAVAVHGRGTQSAPPPRPAGRAGWLALGTEHLVGAPRLDCVRHAVTVAGGVTLGALERALRLRGFTLDADPATPPGRSVGGWLAGGGWDVEGPAPADVLLAARVATPEGVLCAEGADAALLAGSGGRLGVVVEATLRVRARPPVEVGRRLVRPLDEVLAALRTLGEAEPHALAAGADELAAPPAEGRRGWRRPRYADASPTLLGVRVRGDRAARRRALRALRAAAGARAAAAPPDQGFAAAPDAALREALLARGVGLGSVAARAPWTALPDLTCAVRRAVEAALEVHAGGGVVRIRARGAGADVRVALDLLYPVDPAHPVKPWAALREAAAAALHRAGAWTAPVHADTRGGRGLAATARRAYAAAVDPRAVLQASEAREAR